MKYDDKIFYMHTEKFIDKISEYIDKELKEKYHDLLKPAEKFPLFEKQYFLLVGQIEAYTKIQTKIALEKHKRDVNN